MKQFDLSRFTEMHKKDYRTALEEIQNGRKETHWMWYIFPQVSGLGRTAMNEIYAIYSLQEAQAFLRDPYLGGNIREISNALLDIESDDAEEILGYPDNLKLCSSMTLFSIASDGEAVFDDVLDKFFFGRKDTATLDYLGM